MRETLLKSGGVFFILVGLLFNKYFVMWLLGISEVPMAKLLVLIFYEVVMILLGVLIFWKAKEIGLILVRRKYDLLVLVASFLICFVFLELLLRFCLFTPYVDVNFLKQPKYYTDELNEDYWYFTYMFDDRRKIAGDFDNVSGNFCDNSALSIELDGLLGYTRKKKVDVPCHETSNLGTRGLKDYSYDGKKILFYGDSFTESEACSNNTITTMIEDKTGIDTLNYGVGGYGLDQTFLRFYRTAGKFTSGDNVYLIGLINADLERMLLKVRSTTKPYFTVGERGLDIHVEHITDDVDSYFDSYKPKFRLYLLNLMLHKIGAKEFLFYYKAERYNEKKELITQLLLDEFVKLKEKNNWEMYFVLFYKDGHIKWKSDAHAFFKEELDKRGLSYINLKTCLIDYMTETGIPLERFYKGHPTPLGNDVFADCIVEELGLERK